MLGCHCQMLFNNMCEIFNGKMIDGRDKPIISALEYIREYLIRRMCSLQKAIDKKKAQQMRVVFASNEKYQVKGVWNDQYVVNMNERYCTCRKWELTGIPYKHVAVIWDMI
uniref:SWIM-type domain-containing protein n=1 Tax=Lactuca sativa TaxID=4236 RepID=A0A9R1W2B3_LACSA|nr:hypothetical protein LSAT_V11C300150270 [Lactuca sativa]